MQLDMKAKRMSWRLWRLANNRRLGLSTRARHNPAGATGKDQATRNKAGETQLASRAHNAFQPAMKAPSWDGGSFVTAQSVD